MTRSVFVSSVSACTSRRVATSKRPVVAAAGRGGMRPTGIAGGAMAASSSRTSIPTGHQVMHRPQPTQPEQPNWSCQVANLWVSHWRYRSDRFGRKLPPATLAKPMLKQESHSRSATLTVPSRSEWTSVEVQKQVGQTIVQLAQARQRSATSAQRGLSSLSMSRSRSPSAATASSPIAARVAATAPEAAAICAAVARGPGRRASSRSPAGEPEATTKPSSTSVRTRSWPERTSGPVPIEAQKQLAPARVHSTATTIADSRRAR